MNKDLSPPPGLTPSKTRYTRPVFARAHLSRGAVPAGLFAATAIAVAVAASAAPGDSKPAKAAGGAGAGNVETGLPPMPGQSADPAGAESAVPSHPKSDPARFAHAIVVVERHEKPVAVGVILARDGRILTAFSPLGDERAHDIDLRYADGKLVHARVQDHDLGWDLALLVPETAGRAEGLPAASRDPLGQPPGSLVAFAPSKHHVAPVSISLKGRRTFTGAGDVVLADALELNGKITPSELGSPLVDEAGGVVGILGRGCSQAETADGACTVAPFGAPVEAIRGFLRHALAKPAAPPASLGIQVVSDSAGTAKGVRILVVQSEGAGDRAGLRGGERERADLIVAVEGTPVTTPEGLSEAIRGHAPGDRVTLLIYRGGKFREVPVVLQPGPRTTRSEAPPAPTGPAGPGPTPTGTGRARPGPS